MESFEIIKGKIIKILTQKDNDWGRYKLDCAGKEILAVGIIVNAGVGMYVELKGVDEDTKYGRQFSIKEVLQAKIDDLSGVRKFLTDGYIKGIGVTKAEQILAMYGKESVDLFDTEEGRKKLAKIKGITLKTLDKCMESYNENKKYKDIVLFLNGSGTKNQVEKIYSKYGDNALALMKKNPYRIQADVDGFGFIKADAIALAGGIKPDSECRIAAATSYILENAATAEGHCYLTIDEIRNRVIPLLAPIPKFSDITEKVGTNALADWAENKEKLIKRYDPCAETLEKLSQTAETRENIKEALADALSKAFEARTLVNDDGCIYTKSMFDTEYAVAELLGDLASQNPVRFIKPELVNKSIAEVEDRKTLELEKSGISGKFVVTEEQKKAVFVGLMHRVSIISGGPGRGKTAITEIVAETFLKAGKRYDKEDIIMLAPTGRAAQRLTESTGYPAMTAQRAVLKASANGYYPKDKLVIVDESSMVDIFLARQILYYAKDCNLIFVGDVDQIASVGPGKVLRDMIDSGKIPSILLKQGHRNSGTIAHNSELINAGLKLDKYAYDKCFVYIPATAENIADLMIRDYIEKAKQYGIKNVMLCVAMRQRGCASVKKLNTQLQAICTKGRPEAVYGENIFRVGDRVMQTKNDYTFQVKRNGSLEQGIFNGERGTIVNIVYNEDMEDYNITVLFDDNSLGGYSRSTICNLTLAYATTLHKCQGSEAKCMMMAYTFGDYMLLNRSLFYTGETRAKEEFRFYGEEQVRYGKLLSAFDIAVGKTDDTKRNTGLINRLSELLAA